MRGRFHLGAFLKRLPCKESRTGLWVCSSVECHCNLQKELVWRGAFLSLRRMNSEATHILHIFKQFCYRPETPECPPWSVCRGCSTTLALGGDQGQLGSGEAGKELADLSGTWQGTWTVDRRSSPWQTQGVLVFPMGCFHDSSLLWVLPVIRRKQMTDTEALYLVSNEEL